jgi:hypothetical protein
MQSVFQELGLAGCSEARANTRRSHPVAATRNASLNVKFELYMTASHFDGMAHNL